MTAENSVDILLASASCYPAFPMMVMNGDDYIDGGYADNVPVDLALKMGAKRSWQLMLKDRELLCPYSQVWILSMLNQCFH